METSGSLQPELGRNLRSARTERGLRLTDVSTATGISPAFLSLVETGKTDITVSRLVRLLACYGLSLGQLVPGAGEGARAAVAERVFQFASPAEGIEFVFLGSHPGPRSMLPVLIQLAPGAAESESVQVASDIVVTVLEGHVEIAIDGQAPFVLAVGETGYLDAGAGHVKRNADAGQPARALLVIARPPAVAPA